MNFDSGGLATANSPNRQPAGQAGLARQSGTIPKWLIAVLFAIALTSRVWAAMVLPNAEQDGYSYAEIIAALTRQFQTTQFHVADLYGFWLPLFQVATAVLNMWIQDPIIAGKIVNVICGTVATMLVFDITRLLTRSLAFSLLAFLLVFVDPLHLLYSAACMTDVPHSTVVLASAWFGLRRHWLAAAVLGGLAECIRIESWALLIALPLLQYIYERRVSLWTLLILLVPPIGWFGITYAATGNLLAYFHERARYHAEYMDFHPSRHGFHWRVVSEDAIHFLLGAGKPVAIGAGAAGVIAFWRWVQTRKVPNPELLVPVVYFTAMLGLIVVAYITKAQPVLLPRYGLMFFTIGVPLFAWAVQLCLAQLAAQWIKAAIILAVAIGCGIEIEQQLPTLLKVRDDFRAHQKIALALVDNMKDFPQARCFSDDVAVRVISGLPPERFLRSAAMERPAAGDAGSFLTYLRRQNAQFLVFFPAEDSLPVKLFPDLARPDGTNNGAFEFVAFAASSFGPDIWLYRLRDR